MLGRQGWITIHLQLASRLIVRILRKNYFGCWHFKKTQHRTRYQNVRCSKMPLSNLPLREWNLCLNIFMELNLWSTSVELNHSLQQVFLILSQSSYVEDSFYGFDNYSNELIYFWRNFLYCVLVYLEYMQEEFVLNDYCLFPQNNECYWNIKGSNYVLMFLTRDIIILLYVYDGAFYEKLHTLYTLHIYQAYDFSKSLKIFFLENHCCIHV